jgi:hypothetical protein
MKTLLSGLLALAMALAADPAARADTFSYTFVGSGLDAAVTFTAVSNSLPDDTYTITSVAGTISAGTDIPFPATFTAADVVNDPYAPGGYDTFLFPAGGGSFEYDNQLFPSQNPVLDYYGVLFDVSGVYINIYSDNGICQWADNGSYTNFTNTDQPISPIPEPWPLPLLGTGLFGLVFAVYRKAVKRSFPRL